MLRLISTFAILAALGCSELRAEVVFSPGDRVFFASNGSVGTVVALLPEGRAQVDYYGKRYEQALTDIALSKGCEAGLCVGNAVIYVNFVQGQVLGLIPTTPVKYFTRFNDKYYIHSRGEIIRKPKAGEPAPQAQELWDQGRRQEAVWLAADRGDLALAEKLQAQLFKLLETDAITSTEQFSSSLGPGIARKAILTLASGIRVLFKPDSQGTADTLGITQSEVAVSRIDRALGLFLVPTTATREDHGARGSAQYLVPFAKNARDDRFALPEAIQFLDSLIVNTDRNGWYGANYMRISDLQRPFAVDHNRSLLPAIQTPTQEFARFPNRRVLQKLREFDEARMKAALGDILNIQQLSMLAQRRQSLLSAADGYLSLKKDESALIDASPWSLPVVAAPAKKAPTRVGSRRRLK